MEKLLLILVLLSGEVILQKGNFWQVLAEVNFESETDKNGYTIEKPVFSKYLKSFDGKKVKLKGYLIPLSETGGKENFMLSSLPFNVCYFCGAAGPETVVEIETAKNLKFSTRPIVLEGILLLNASNPDHHIYILKSAVLSTE